MNDLLHNRELVVRQPSVMTSFYAAMKCCVVGSWKSGSTSTYLSVSLNVKYRQIRDKSLPIIRSVMEDFVWWFCTVKKVNPFLLRLALKKFVDELETTVRVQKQRLQTASVKNFCKGFENRFACFVFQRLSPCKVWKLFNDNQHERVTVIEHFRIWQVNQISLPLIINTADDSATTLEITTNKAMQSAVIHSPLMASAYNFINPQRCDVAFSCFWKVETGSERCSQVVNTRYCKYFEDSSYTNTHLTNQNCERRLRQILQWNYSFVLNWFCLVMWVRVGTSLNVLHIWIGRNKSWWKTCRP